MKSFSSDDLIKVIKEATGKTIKIKYTNFGNTCVFSVGKKKCQISISIFVSFLNDTNNCELELDQLSVFSLKIIEALELKVNI